MRTVICDLECNGLNPTRIWCVVAKDIKTHELFTFLEGEEDSFRAFAGSVGLWIGHNFLCFDRRVLSDLWNVTIGYTKIIDTLICSRLFADQLAGEKNHALEDWGFRLGMPKISNDEWEEYSPIILERCKRDVELNHRVFEHLRRDIQEERNQDCLRLEHDVALICEDLHDTGFTFEVEGALRLLERIQRRLERLSEELKSAFPPRATLIREVNPRQTLAGGLHMGDFRWDYGDLGWYAPGSPFSRLKWKPFNPGSHKDVIDVLWKAGWNPADKTKGHMKAEKDGVVSEEMKRYGWKVNELNLETLPKDAPEASRKLTEWLMFEGRRSTLEEWLTASGEAPRGPSVDPDYGTKIHARFYHIGTWTHRMSTAGPNMQNIPAPKSKYQEPRLKEITVWLGHVMRGLWIPRPGWKLIGVDGDQIQLRILAHLLNDEKIIEALVSGEKAKGTDLHSVNAKVLGLSRDDAKNWIYAFCLGAGVDKLAKMCYTNSVGMVQKLKGFYDQYPGLEILKKERLKEEAKRGYVELIDGRRIRCNSSHLVLAAHLQGNEAVIMKWACREWRKELKGAGLLKGRDYNQVNFVHDEWQTEARHEPDLIEFISERQRECISRAGEVFGLVCPLRGNSKVGDSWADTH